MATQKKLAEIVEYILVELYANSTPTADFHKLVKEAEINERGEKVIDYNAYEIEQEKAQEILDKHTKKLSRLEKQAVRINIWLGCSPKFKIEKDE